MSKYDDKVGQLPELKGEAAEDSLSCPGKCFWGIAEYVIHCHRNVECYRCYGNIRSTYSHERAFTKSFMVF